MIKQKFKVADTVRIVEVSIPSAIGTIGELREIDNDDIPYYVNGLWCRKVELVKRKKHPVIVITSDGKTTTATMREGKKVIKTATATCSDKDTFDYDEGARIAFERLQGREPFLKEEKKNALFSGKVVCIDVKGIRVPYTVGKTYRCEKERYFSGDDSGKDCCYLGARADAENRFRVGFVCGEAFFIPFVED